ncbi:hypothetical protein [Variovorax defluvii]|uniref:hypothetical protein n=1 Tax=Variovorax defluvii TaxID=913761 RepID=UPI0031EBAA62
MALHPAIAQQQEAEELQLASVLQPLQFLQETPPEQACRCLRSLIEGLQGQTLDVEPAVHDRDQIELPVVTTFPKISNPSNEGCDRSARCRRRRSGA